MAGATSSNGFRRGGDGSPDFAFYRRRAVRLRRAARAGLWRRVRQRTAGPLAFALTAAPRLPRFAGADTPGACASHPEET